MIDKINDLLDKDLTLRHRDVVESMRKNLRKWGSLSERQGSYLDSIASKYTDEILQEQADFGRKLKEDKDLRERVRVTAQYYLRTGYYRNIATDALAWLDDGVRTTTVPPTYDNISKMLNNKYAERLWESHNSEPKYAVGEMVQIRASLGRDNIKGDTGLAPRGWVYASKDKLKTSTFLIVEVDSFPISRSLTYCEKKGGTRWYKLLPLGETEVIHVIERELKRPTAKLLRGE